ncbi:hypothetical protein IQ238_08605 [Pleurocapsales cyanobacterium LEGE 06147]|nr:hypothetical protein [Pleurocapsales cyanobacterium LEGE 06147]
MGTDTIADYLNIEVADIREVRPFQYVYFVIFNIRRRPTFASKREIAARDALKSIFPPALDLTPKGYCGAIAHRVVTLDDPKHYQARTYQVLARTDIRRGRYGSYNRGIKIKDIETGEISWINNERPFDRDRSYAVEKKCDKKEA